MQAAPSCASLHRSWLTGSRLEAAAKAGEQLGRVYKSKSSADSPHQTDTSERQRNGNKVGEGEPYLSDDLGRMVRQQQQQGQGILPREWRCTSRARESKGQTEPAPRQAALAARIGQGGGASPAPLLGEGEKE